jgi:hypothetical protein
VEETSGSVLTVLGRRALRLLSSPEEVALLLLFLGLVAFGLNVAWRIVSAW